MSRSIRRSLFTYFLVSSCSLGSINAQSVVFAQIVPDKSTATEVRGNTIAPVGAGTVNGGNLFNSFDKFNVPNSGVVFGTGNSSVDGTKINNIINRVTGDTPSQILGTIESRAAFPSANLFLMNPNGVVFGKDARLDIGGSFNVSTGTSLGFAGDRKFSVDKTSLDFPSGNPQNIQFAVSQPAAIINQGNLSVDAGKNISFTAGAIVNSGALTAPSGNVALTSVAGGSVVDLRSPDLVLGLSVVKNAVPTDWNGSITTLPKLAELLTGKAQQGDRVVVKPDGSLAIVVSPASNEVPVTNGTTVVSGLINASSVSADGGKVGIFGDRVAVVNSQITANGGKVLIGGDFQGKGVVPNAQFTYFDNKSVVDVSALQIGNGGKVVVWGDLSTRFLGSIVANAGNVSGDGGFVEVSSKANLDYRGIVSTLAPNGNLGTLLLDPTDITLVASGGFFAALTDVDNFADPNGTVNTLNVGLINNALSNVVLQATNNININQPINITGLGIGFTAQAGNNINVNQNITTNRGAIALLANNGATATGSGSVIFAGTSINTNGGNFTASGFNFNSVTSINTSSTTGVNSGNIDVNVTGAINANPSTLFTGINSGFTGNAGFISLKATGNIFANVLQAADAVGGTVINGGNVTVDAGGSLTIGTLGSISTRSTSGGKAGDVLLKSGGSITALGTTGINTSVIGTSVGGSQAGNVTLQAGTFINTDAAIASSINSNSVIGNAGNITFTTNGSISATGDLIAANLGTGNAGKIDLTSNNDGITTGNLISASLNAAADVTLKAATNITTGYILGLGVTKASNVSLTATSGTIQLLNTIPSSLFGVTLSPCIGANICTAALNGTSGNITLSAGGAFNTTAATSFFTSGGNITITGASATATAPLTFNTFSSNGGGKVDITIAGNITSTSSVNFNTYLTSGGLGNSGDVSLKSTSGNISLSAITDGSSSLGTSRSLSINALGNITLPNILAVSSIGNSSNIIVNAGGNITTGALITGGVLAGNGKTGNVQLTSTSGNITTTDIIAGIAAVNNTNNAGNITLSALGNVNLISADTSITETTATGNAGKISITSTNGLINATGNISSGVLRGSGNGNDLILSAKGSVAAVNVGTGTVFGNGNGGNIQITGDSIAVATLGASALGGGTSGNTTLNATNNITAGFILSSGNSKGGDVSLTSTAGTIQLTSTVPSSVPEAPGVNLSPCVGSSICSAARNGTAGNININGNLSLPNATKFLSTGTTNGGAINLQNANINGTQNLTLDSGTGAVTLSNTGATTKLGTLTINAGSILANQAIAAKNISFTTTGNITTQLLNTSDSVSGSAGNVTIQSNNGNIAIGSITTSPFTTGNNAGNVTIQARGDITLTPPASSAAIDAFVSTGNTGNGGTVSITSSNGKVTTGAINTSADFGNAGNVTVQSFGDITTTGNFTVGTSIFAIDAFSTSTGNGGKVSLTSSNGAIDVSSGVVSTSTQTGTAGSIVFNASGNITTGGGSASNSGVESVVFFGGTGTPNLISFTSKNGTINTTLGDIGGDINFTANNGNVTSSNIFTASGNLTILASGDIGITGQVITSLANANGNGGKISLTSNSGSINVSNLTNESGIGGNSGIVNLQAFGNITVGLIQAYSDSGNASQIKLTSQTGSIKTGSLFSDNNLISNNTGSGSGADIIIQAPLGNITTDDVSSYGTNGNAGNVTFTAGGNISLLSLRATSTGGKAGNVNLQASGNITLTGNVTLDAQSLAIGFPSASTGTDYAIAAFSDTGNGGNISLTSTNGAINASLGRVDSSSISGVAGNITFQASQNIVASSVFARSNQSSVSFTSTNGNISLESINTSSPFSGSDAGRVTIQAKGDIAIISPSGNEAIDAISDTGNGGDVSITSSNGNVTNGTIYTYSRSGSGNGGNVTIKSFGDIRNTANPQLAGVTIFAAISTTSNSGNSGNISLTSSSGIIDIGLAVINSDVGSTGGNAGSILLTALGNINTKGIFSATASNGNGGLVDLRSGGAISFNSINSRIRSGIGTAGNIDIQAVGNITSNGSFNIGGQNYAIISSNSGVGNGGNISLKSTNGAIDVSSGLVSTSASAGTAGSISFTAFGDIKTGAGTTPNPAVASFVTTGGNGTPNSIAFTSTNGAINTSLGDIDAGGGNITFVARNNITTSGVFSRPLNSTNRTISLTSQLGAIDTSAGDLTTTNFSGNGGNITLVADGNITTKGVFASGDNGKISITSNKGSIDTSKDTPTSIGSNNSITLQADQNIKAANIIATGNNTTISIASTKGIVDTTLGFIQGGITPTQTGSGGNITIKAEGDILTGTVNAPNLSTSISGNAGSVFLTSSNGKVQFTGVSARRNGGNGNGGNITVQAQGDIISTGVLSFGNVSLSSAGISKAGDIKLTSNAGKIDVSSGAIGGLDNSFQSFTPNGNITFKSASDIILGDFNGATAFGAGSISLTATGSGAKITTGNISVNTQSIDPGSVNFIASGDITTKNINTSSLFSNGNSISLTSRTGAVTTGNLNASGGNNGADVVVIAQTAITTGAIATQGSTGRGGNVVLDPVGNVTFASINATGNTTLGGGGNINIVSTGGNVLGTGIVTFSTGDPCAGATICTNGTGTVSIQHGITSPFDLNTFLVGSATTNGTLGTIIAGGSTILSLQGIPNGAGFFTQGNISITPGGGIFIPPPIPPIPPSTPATPSTPSTPSTSTGTFINPIIITSTPPVVVSVSRPPAVDINEIAKRSAGEYLALGRFDDALNEMEKGKISEFENYLGETLTSQVKNLEQIQQDLEEVSNRSGSVTTVVYPIILSDRLELLIIPPKGKGKPFREYVAAAKESAISPVIQDFANNIRDVGSQDYLEQSQKLYDWLVRPFSDRLATINSNTKPDTQINSKQNDKPSVGDKLVPNKAEAPQEKLPPTLVFVMDGGLRVIPVAALHDGKQFLIEKYALANLPYLRATRLETRDRRLNNVLAMGLTESVQGFSALPSVKVEVSTISSQVLGGDSYLDKEFTIENLQTKRRQGNFAVLHLATHAKFVSNDAQGAFIQFWNERLSIDRIPSLRFDSPLIEMLTLSACQTAVGQNLGLGGLSVSSGARSVLASLWEVSDTGTAPLMIQFYNSFPENITKAIALQRSQIEILQGKVTIKDGKIFGLPKLPTVPLSQAFAGEVDIKHPYFWSSFILIGNWL